jgi:hypothetical protein
MEFEPLCRPERGVPSDRYSEANPAIFGCWRVPDLNLHTHLNLKLSVVAGLPSCRLPI